MGHVGHGSRGSWVTWVMGHVGHWSRGSWVTWVMGQFTDGSRVIKAGQLDPSSALTKAQLRVGLMTSPAEARCNSRK